MDIIIAMIIGFILYISIGIISIGYFNEKDNTDNWKNVICFWPLVFTFIFITRAMNTLIKLGEWTRTKINILDDD